MAAAANAGLPQAIVTTSGRGAVEALLLQLLPELMPQLAVRVCGEDVARKKPDPEGYQRALALLGLVPGQVVAIEDSPPGLAAAHAAGLTTVVTLSEFSAAEPLSRFERATAIWDGLGEPAAPATRLQGPDSTAGLIDLDYLRSLRSRR